MDAETADGVRHALLLQNAETVRLVGPDTAAVSSSRSSGSGVVPQSAARSSLSSEEEGYIWQHGGHTETEADEPPSGAAAGPAAAEGGWRALSVTELRPGDSIYVMLSAGARHTGISIEESIVER